MEESLFLKLADEEPAAIMLSQILEDRAAYNFLAKQLEEDEEVNMLTVFSQVLGQPQEEIKIYSGTTISELRGYLDLSSHYVAKIRRVYQDDSYELSPYDIVVWAEKCKGN